MRERETERSHPHVLIAQKDEIKMKTVLRNKPVLIVTANTHTLMQSVFTLRPSELLIFRVLCSLIELLTTTATREGKKSEKWFTVSFALVFSVFFRLFL